jgi:hypothetical protein
MVSVNSRPSSHASTSAVLQTAVRQLSAQELVALKTENERLLRLEQALSERERSLREREEQVGEMVGKLRAETAMLRERLVDGHIPSVDDFKSTNDEVSGRVVAASELYELQAKMSEAGSKVEQMRVAYETSEGERTRLAELVSTYECERADGDMCTHVLRRSLGEADAEMGLALGALAHAEAWLAACDEQKEQQQQHAREPHGQQQQQQREDATACATLVVSLRDLETQLDEREAATTASLSAAEGTVARLTAQLATAEAKRLELEATATAALEARSAAQASQRLAEEAAEGHAEHARASQAEARKVSEALTGRTDELAKCNLALMAIREEAERLRAEAEQARAQAAAEAAAAAEARVRAAEREHEQREAAQRAKEASKMREAVLKEAIGRAEAARAAQEEARADADAAAKAEAAAVDNVELLSSHVRRLEKRLEKQSGDVRQLEDRCLALQRRLEALAAAGTEANSTDVGYWVERGKRDVFAHAALSHGAVKRLEKAAKTAARKAGEAGHAMQSRASRLDPTDGEGADLGADAAAMVASGDAGASKPKGVPGGLVLPQLAR